jgi:polysaccharide pyruvyl transferase CsaB
MKIFLIGWFGAGNIGDEAILLSELLFLRDQIEDAEFHILSFNPERTRQLTAGISEVKKILRMGSKRDAFKSDFGGIYRAFREVDIVMIGGGGIFQDIYNFYPIPFFTAMALLARLNGKRLILYCVGIGPIRSFIGKIMCRLAANSATIICVRDAGSQDLLKTLKVKKPVYLSADPVFLLEPVKNENVDKVIRSHHLDKNGPVIGVSVQTLLFWREQNQKILAGVLDTLVREKGATITFFPFGIYKDGWFNRDQSDTVDMAASKKLTAMMREEYSILNSELTPQELLAVIQKLNLMVSMRLHGLIMALISGVPVIALTYKEESKLRTLMKSLNQEDTLFDVNALSYRELLDKIEHMLFVKGDASRKYHESVSSIRAEAEKCNQMVLRALIGQPGMEGN